MRELNEAELKAVSGGAGTTEYAILSTQPSPPVVAADSTASEVLKSRHETAKNAIGNIR